MCSVPTAAPTATPYTASAVPSLIRLSARTRVAWRRGSRPATAATAVASVGARTAPSTHAIGQASPSACPTTATVAAVARTSTTDDRKITRRFARASRSEVFSDSQYSSAGRKRNSTTSGGISTSPRPGTKPTATPSSSCTSGAGSRTRGASTPPSSTRTPTTTMISRPLTRQSCRVRGLERVLAGWTSAVRRLLARRAVLPLPVARRRVPHGAARGEAVGLRQLQEQMGLLRRAQRRLHVRLGLVLDRREQRLLRFPLRLVCHRTLLILRRPGADVPPRLADQTSGVALVRGRKTPGLQRARSSRRAMTI